MLHNRYSTTVTCTLNFRLLSGHLGVISGTLYSAICDYYVTQQIQYYCNVYPQLLLVIGAPRGYFGNASGISLPRPLWVGGCPPHATPCSVPGYSYHCTMCRLQVKMQQSSRVTFYSRVCRVLPSELVEQEQKLQTTTNNKHASRRPKRIV